MGKDVEEILDYPLWKLTGWSAYFRIKAEEEQKAAKRNRSRNRRKPTVNMDAME